MGSEGERLSLVCGNPIASCVGHLLLRCTFSQNGWDDPAWLQSEGHPDGRPGLGTMYFTSFVESFLRTMAVDTIEEKAVLALCDIGA